MTRPGGPEFEAYFNVADELDGGLTLDDLDESVRRLARTAATERNLPWPPQLADAEEAWNDLRLRQR